MSHKKGFKLTYGVFSYTCSNFSFARSLYKQQRLIVVYTFNQKSLMHKGIKIVVEQGENRGELIVHPQRAKEPKITKVELLDGNYKPIPKGKQISYKDTIIARAHCVEMFKMNVAFTLWEDDAQGEGHDPIKNTLNKINIFQIFLIYCCNFF